MAMQQPAKPTKFMKCLKLHSTTDRGAWHAEPRKGTEEQAMDYANKDETRAPGAQRRLMYSREVYFDTDSEDELSSDECEELQWYWRTYM